MSPDLLPSPTLAIRRQKTPRLPLSVFTPPPTGEGSSGFPLAPDPSTMHPTSVVDAGVALGMDGSKLKAWPTEATEFADKAQGLVAIAPDLPSSEAFLKSFSDPSVPQVVKVVSVVVPISLADGAPSPAPAYLTSSTVPVAVSSKFAKASEAYVEGITWALRAGHVVELDVQADLSAGDLGWEALVDVLAKATADSSAAGKSKAIILTNVLPPPGMLDMPIVKLLTHPIYKNYQAHISSLSLFANVYVKCAPPNWGPVPAASSLGVRSPEPEEGTDSKDRKEWKRKVKMYLGPAIEAFGFSRIIYSSTGSSGSPPSRAGDWYTLVRECLAELGVGVEQDALDAVFAGNALQAYSS